MFVKQLGPSPYEVIPLLGKRKHPSTDGLSAALEYASQTRHHIPEGWTRVVHPDGSAELYKYLRPSDKKGGDMSEWPEDLRVREFPEVTR